MKVRLEPTPLPGLHKALHGRHGDARGGFDRIFDSKSVPGFAGGVPAQANWSRTTEAGTVRGMHFQEQPHAETKAITCLRGAAFDVAVDLRRGSPTFLLWHAEHLTPDCGFSLIVPEGFAHGFQALEPDTHLLYLHSVPYDTGAERGLRPTDPRLAIGWPLTVRNLSPRDAAHPLLDSGFQGVAA